MKRRAASLRFLSSILYEERIFKVNYGRSFYLITGRYASDNCMQMQILAGIKIDAFIHVKEL